VSKNSVLKLTVSIFLFSLVFLVSFSVKSGFENFRVNAQESGLEAGETYQTNPKDRERTVTATVPDIVEPSTPILIAPENTALLQDSTPTFIWQESQDNVGVTNYQLFLDGEILFATIPTVNTSNSQFTLVYDSNNDQYSLTPNSGISDGDHTWKIRALDARDNFADSATWSFEIDSRAPQFIITLIEDVVTSISAFDLDTIPEQPHELKNNQPEISGTSEAGSTIQITLRGEGLGTSTVTLEVEDDDTWSWQLGILPRDVIIYLDFLITDSAGNITILENLPLILRTVAGVDPAATPLPSGAAPAETSGFPGGLSALEWRHIIIKQVLPLLPPSLKQLAEDELISPMVTAIQPQSFKHRLGPLLIVTPLAVSFGLIALLTPQLTISILWQILLLILPLLRRRNCGLVFAFQDSRAIPYVAVSYHGFLSSGKEFYKTVITNVYGQFSPGKLPEGEYSVVVDHPGFPLQNEELANLNQAGLYLGQSLVINQPVDACIKIPVSQSREAISKARAILLWLAQLTNPRSVFRWVWLLLGGFVIFLYPSQYNWLLFIIVAGIYALDVIMKPFYKN
jgi:hypothetical protein